MQCLSGHHWPLLIKQEAKRRSLFFVCFSQEFLQTEMHHVRTLKILLHVYMYELRQRSILDEARLFCGVESMLVLHQDFLSCLKAHQSTSQEDGSPNVYQIAEFADILISQVSLAERGERQRKLVTHRWSHRWPNYIFFFQWNCNSWYSCECCVIFAQTSPF